MLMDIFLDLGLLQSPLFQPLTVAAILDACLTFPQVAKLLSSQSSKEADK